MTQHKAYGSAFYEYMTPGNLRSARRVVPLFLERFPVASVLDVGCGWGTWLSAFQEAGIASIHGVDGPWVAPEKLLIPPENFQSVDLEAPLPDLGPFDLVVNLEVAEHLTEARAASFVDDLIRMAPRVLFSAAIPGQGGDDHLNEQWQDYWTKLFTERGMVALDFLRDQVWLDPEVAWWYRQNLLVYVRPELVPEGLSEMPARLSCRVDPENFKSKWSELQRARRSRGYRLGRYLRRLPGRILRRR